MAWERNFEKKILKIRDKELKYQKLNYVIEVPIILFQMFCLLSPFKLVLTKLFFGIIDSF